MRSVHAGNSGSTQISSRFAATAALALLFVCLAAGVAASGARAEGPPGVVSPVDATASRASSAASPSSIIVVRRQGGRDALWRAPPADGSATKLVDLAFRPSRVEQSPDGARLALLTSGIGPRVYVYDVADSTVKTLSLAARGVRSVDSLTWLSPTRLLVAGSPVATRVAYPLGDKLYALNVVTGASASFRDLRGTEPSAAPAAARLVFVRLTDAGAAPNQPGSRVISEKLMSLRLAAGTAPRVIGSARYVNSYDIRRFRDPRVSPAGRFVVTSTTGSDVSVSYMVRWVATGKAFFTLHTTLAGGNATAWRPQGAKVAFWGMPPAASTMTTRLYVYDALTRKLTSIGPFSKVTVTGLPWSPDGTQIAFALCAFNAPADVATLWRADPATTTAPTQLGAGSLPVWLP